jgi:hypothetical protein
MGSFVCLFVSGQANDARMGHDAQQLWVHTVSAPIGIELWNAGGTRENREEDPDCFTAGCVATSRKVQSAALLYAGLAAGAESLRESAANLGVDSVELRSGSGHRCNAHDRNQRGDQAIFNGGHAGFVFDETREELHRKDPFRGLR